MIQTFDRTNLRALREELDASLAAIGKKHGVSFQIGKIRFQETTFKASIECSTTGTNGEVNDPRRQAYVNYAQMFGLKAEWLDRPFVFAGETFTVCGLKPKATRLPILA